MTNRRSFFSSLCGVAAATTAAAIPVAPKSEPDQFERKGWKYFWSGWITLPEWAVQRGHWTAYRIDSAFRQQKSWPYMDTDAAFSTTGGDTDWLGKGYMLPQSHREPHKLIEPNSPQAEKDYERRDALNRLTAFLDKRGDEPWNNETKTSKPPKAEFKWTGFKNA